MSEQKKQAERSRKTDPSGIKANKLKRLTAKAAADAKQKARNGC